jgi:hypothetical protein
LYEDEARVVTHTAGCVLIVQEHHTGLWIFFISMWKSNLFLPHFQINAITVLSAAAHQNDRDTCKLQWHHIEACLSHFGARRKIAVVDFFVISKCSSLIL